MKSRKECIDYLMKYHFAKYTQAETAVNNYRRRRGLTPSGPKMFGPFATEF